MTTIEEITMQRAGDLASFDADSNTVEATLSSFADVTRRDALGQYIERLDPAGLDTSKLTGAPLLDGHRQGSARDVVGTVESYSLEGDSLTAVLRLSKAGDAQDIVTRIQEKTLKGVSIGYSVQKWAESTDPQTKLRIKTATAWQIFEVSAVPIPADTGATFRSHNVTTETTQADEITASRAAIRQVARSANLTPEWADEQIDAGGDVTAARAAAFEAMQAKPQTRIRTVGSNDDPAVIQTRRADALYSRLSGEAPKDDAKPYMQETLRDMARACVEAAGQNTRTMNPDDLFRAAMHTTTDFPNLLTSTGNRTLMSAYQAAQSPLKQVARQSTLPDFRAGTRLKLSDIGQLQKVTESGEITHTTRGEAAESYSLDTYASQFAISRKALINDDLGAFRDWGQTAGRMAAETEANLLLTLLLSNPTMGEDSTALFHADHSNLAGTPGTIAIASLDTARQALRNMTALDGTTPINATPKFLIVGPALETTAEQVLAAIYAATVDDVNPFTGKLTLLVEPRITDSSWYLFADPAVLPVLEYSYLSSAQGPQMSSREGWDVLGMEYRVVLDFGAGAIDFRGAYKNAGA
jgi:HK97 family phage prohead protease